MGEQRLEAMRVKDARVALKEGFQEGQVLRTLLHCLASDFEDLLFSIGLLSDVLLFARELVH